MKKVLFGFCIVGIVGSIVLLRPEYRHQTTKPPTTPADTTSYTILGPTEYQYGKLPLEAVDVYTPGAATSTPIIVMVHGGGWQIGDKATDNIVKNKVAFWVPRGYMFISINYPMLESGYKPKEQADAVAQALMYIQKNATSWGGDPTQMVVMGHSAGAHLVSLVDATQMSYSNLAPWNGTVLLDSAAYDVVQKMTEDHEELFDQAFGDDPTYWQVTSPLAQLTAAPAPTFVVCSSVRAASVCSGAEIYKNKIISLGGAAEIYKEPLKHEFINSELGLPGPYTEAVDAFIRRVTFH